MFLSMGYGTYLFFGLLTLLGGVYVFFVVVRRFLSFTSIAHGLTRRAA